MTKRHKKNMKRHSRRLLYAGMILTVLLILVHFEQHGFNFKSLMELQGYLITGIAEAFGIKIIGAD